MFKQRKVATKEASQNDVVPVYIRSADHSWVPALQLKTYNGMATVAVPKFKDEREMMNCAKKSKQFKYHDNQLIPLKDYPGGSLPMQNVDGQGNVEDYKDMVDLPFMHEAAILYNLKLRHSRERPYTRTGDIVIAVNPYQWFNELYSEQKQYYYSNRLVWDLSQEDPRAVMEPHVYEVSALAYKGLAMGEGENQSILVSGESGAGKTETVKICLNHIASVQRGNHPPGYHQGHDPVVRRVVESNPLLEAFGNAKTRRNDNSSRFGKYLQLQFQKRTGSAALVGSKCDVYLLEKNRVVGHADGERTFHIFYQLLAASEEDKARFWDGLRGKSNESFSYVGSTKTRAIEGVSDGDRFYETLEALALVGVKDEVLDALMRAICIVLQIGNLRFKDFNGDCDRSAVSTPDVLDELASLVGLTSADLSLALSERTFATGKESHKVPLNKDAALEARDALAKEAYQKTFLWLVKQINEATAAEERPGLAYGTVGLLDIFGFEVFPHNQFEQLCINYANEKLQQKFNQDIFKNVQAEYKAEGISLDEVRFEDNTDVLDLIEGRTGLLKLLNEECVRPKGNDLDYVHKALRINTASPALIVNKTDRLSFGVKHYAGTVMYDAEFFVVKNLDTLPTDLQSCIEKCSNPIISAPRSESVPPAKMGLGRRQHQSNITAPTVWTKYRSQLNNLMTDLRQTQSRYIRCIKPNTQKLPLVMEHQNTIEQLRCAGVVAGITIARAAFPNRLPNSVVLARYSNMWDMEAYPSKRTDDMTETQKRQCDCEALMESALHEKEIVDKDGKVVKAFVTGKTKTFFRSGALEFLEAGRCSGLDEQAVTIQKAARGWLARNGGRHNRHQRELEEQAREAARLAEEERRARMMQEAAERRAAHLARQKELSDQAEALQSSLDDVQNNATLKDLEGQNSNDQRDLNNMRSRFADEEREAEEQIAAQLAEQERKLELASRIIQALRKENRSERKKHAKVKSKHDETTRNRNRLVAGRDGLLAGCDSEGLGGAKHQKSQQALLDELAGHKKMNVDLIDRLRSQQAKYLEQAQARLKLQKNMGSVLTVVQNKSKDRDLIKTTTDTGMRAQSSGRLIMEMLDLETLAPDLTSSDNSDSSSSDFY